MAAPWAGVFMNGRRNGTSSRWTPAGVLGAEGRAHHAGMQRVGGDGRWPRSLLASS